MEIILWVVTIVIAGGLLLKNLDVFIDSCKWWLQVSPSLFVRLPIFVLAIWCLFGGIELVYNLNLVAWFTTSTPGHLAFRWWLLLLFPIVLAVAGLGFGVPLVVYFYAIPRLYRTGALQPVVRVVLSGILALSVPALMYFVQSILPDSIG